MSVSGSLIKCFFSYCVQLDYFTFSFLLFILIYLIIRVVLHNGMATHTHLWVALIDKLVFLLMVCCFYNLNDKLLGSTILSVRATMNIFKVRWKDGQSQSWGGLELGRANYWVCSHAESVYHVRCCSQIKMCRALY